MKNEFVMLMIILPTIVLLLTMNNAGIVFSQTANQAATSNIVNYKIPLWVKNNAGWWANGTIGDQDFLKGIEYLINQTIIVIPPTNQLTTNASYQEIPVWIKHNAGWWANGTIGDQDFVKGMEFLIANEIIHVNMQNNNQCPSGQYFDALSNACVSTAEKQLLLHIFSPHNPPELLAIFDRHTTPNDFISSFQTQPLDLYPKLNHALSGYSMDSINAAIETAKSHGNIKYIAYDNEKNNGNLSTPSTELLDPSASTNEAASLAKQAGLGFAAEPTHDLLMQEYKGVDWAKVDFMVMQMQHYTTNDASFISDVTTVSDWIKSKNPNTIIFVQFNTAFDTIPHLISLTKSVSSKIDGVSVVIPDPATVEPLLVGIGR
ncbi:MAG TPA: hypothetical protein VEJ68_01265 [Candidatus Bathyarchaeia archaeon]|nr:hypothetical protein [Candidatus Bathyarchaeia archaeon]